MSEKKSDLESIDILTESYAALKKEIGKVIVGQDEIIHNLLISLFSKGHCLLVGVPGLAKTRLISTIGGRPNHWQESVPLYERSDFWKYHSRGRDQPYTPENPGRPFTSHAGI